MEIINPKNSGNPFGDAQPMGCGSEALAPPNTNGGGAPSCYALRVCYPNCQSLD